MAPASTKRQARKRRKTRPAPGAVAPRPERAQRHVPSDHDERQRQSTLGVYGERPPGPFGGFPLSELLIFVGAIAAAVGFFGGQTVALIVGVIVCALGVTEFTAREHFSGYRSHATLLAGMLAVAVGVGMIAAFGASLRRGPLLLAVVPVFGILFWALRKRFRAARQARVVRPPGP